MCKHTCVHITCSKVYEGRKEAEERRVRELEQGAQDRNEQRDFRVRDAELVEVVQVCYTKVQWCQEDNLLSGEVPEHMQRHNE